MARTTKKRTAPATTVKKEKPLTRREVTLKEHADLSTNDLQCRVAYLRGAQEKTSREVEGLRGELSAALRNLRAQGESADALQSLIDGRR